MFVRFSMADPTVISEGTIFASEMGRSSVSGDTKR